MGDVEDGDVFSVSAIDDCAGNGDNAVVNVFVIVGMGDGDDETVVDVCAISVDTSVIDDDDVGGGFVTNDDICNGDGVGDDFSVNDVDMGVVDDDDIANVFVINKDMVEGDDVVDDFSVIGVYDCDKSVVVAVVQASVWIWVKKKCYIKNKACRVQVANPTIYSPMEQKQN